MKGGGLSMESSTHPFVDSGRYWWLWVSSKGVATSTNRVKDYYSFEQQRLKNPIDYPSSVPQ